MATSLSARSAFSFSRYLMDWRQKLALGLFLIFLASCSGADVQETAVPPTPLPSQPPPNLVGDPNQGQALYQRRVLGSNGAPGCITCHSLVQDTVLVGPSHYGLADRAASAVPDQSAETYLWQSIVDPGAHVTAGFAADDMYTQYATELTAQQVADLVAFMLTLHSAQN